MPVKGNTNPIMIGIFFSTKMAHTSEQNKRWIIVSDKDLIVSFSHGQNSNSLRNNPFLYISLCTCITVRAM